MLKKPIALFYDVVSPYSWIAFETLCRYKQKWAIDLILKPFFLGGIMKGAGNSPPMFVPNKGLYMHKDLQRLSQFYQIPLKAPKDPVKIMVEKGSLNAQRLITTVQMHHPEYVESLSRELWCRIWSRGEDIYEKPSLKECLLKIGMDEATCLEMMNLVDSNETKAQLKSVTNEALENKAFGAPFILVNDAKGTKHSIFGSDRMELLAYLIGEKYEGPLRELSEFPAASKL